MLLSEFRQLPFVKTGDGHSPDAHAALGWFFHAGKLVEQSRFAGTGFAIDTADLTLRNGEIDTFQCHDGLVEHWILLTQVFHFDDGSARLHHQLLTFNIRHSPLCPHTASNALDP